MSFGEFGLQSTSRGQITARQIEAARRAITRYLKREGKIFIRVFPDKPITKKPLAVRMGRGKAGVEYWAMNIQPGKILYEVQGVSRERACQALTKGSAKLQLVTKIVEKQPSVVVV